MPTATFEIPVDTVQTPVPTLTVPQATGTYLLAPEPGAASGAIGTSGGGFGNAMTLIGLILLVIVGAYLTSRFLSSKNKAKVTRSSTMNVVDRLTISNDKSILLIELQGAYFLVGVTNHNINILAEPDIDPELFRQEQHYKGSGTPSWLKEFKERMAGTYKAPDRQQMRPMETQRMDRQLNDEQDLKTMEARMRMRSDHFSQRSRTKRDDE